jgi:hypothetical protein
MNGMEFGITPVRSLDRTQASGFSKIRRSDGAIASTVMNDTCLAETESIVMQLVVA